MIFEYQHNCIKNDDILVNANQPRLKIQCHARPHGEWCVGRESGIVPDGLVQAPQIGGPDGPIALSKEEWEPCRT